MIVSFIDESAYGKGEKGVAEGENVHFKRGESTVYHHDSKIPDIHVHGVYVEKALYFRRKIINGIEDCGHIHKKRRKNSPQILHITEKNKKSRKNESHSEIEYNE